MAYPVHRPRRLRINDSVRSLVRETSVSKDDLIYPMFVTAESKSREIPSMPGIYRYTLEDLAKAVETAVDAGIHALMLFGIPSEKDAAGSGGYSSDGIVPCLGDLTA